MKSKPLVTLSSALVYQALEDRYGREAGYAIIPQVRNQTGYSAGYVRTADALAMQLYPSRGLAIIGFEIKVSKADWKREIKDPTKAEAIAQFCHEWVIAAPKGVVPVDEVPHAWGLMEVDSELRTRLVKKPEHRSDTTPITYTFLAAIFRNLGRNTDDAVISEAYERGRKEGKAANDYALQREIDKMKPVYDRAKLFEAASGIDFRYMVSDEQLARVARGIHSLMNGRWDSPFEQIVRDLTSLRNLTRSVLARPAEALDELLQAAEAAKELAERGLGQIPAAETEETP